MVIGCGGNEHDHSCALEDPDLLNLDTVGKLFKDGVEEGLPNQKDPLSHLFDKNSKLMNHSSMKKIFHFLKNIGLDRRS